MALGKDELLAFAHHLFMSPDLVANVVRTTWQNEVTASHIGHGAYGPSPSIFSPHPETNIASELFQMVPPSRHSDALQSNFIGNLPLPFQLPQSERLQYAWHQLVRH
jgi:hypothetical protein